MCELPYCFSKVECRGLLGSGVMFERDESLVGSLFACCVASTTSLSQRASEGGRVGKLRSLEILIISDSVEERVSQSCCSPCRMWVLHRDAMVGVCVATQTICGGQPQMAHSRRKAGPRGRAKIMKRKHASKARSNQQQQGAPHAHRSGATTQHPTAPSATQRAA